MQEERLLISPGDLVLVNDYSEERYWEKNRLRWAEVLKVERTGEHARLSVEGIDTLFDARLILDWTPIV
jgi:hypothetical protein